MGGSTPPAASTPSPLSYGGLDDSFAQVNALNERYRKEGEYYDEQAKRQKELADKSKAMGEQREKELAPLYAGVDKSLNQPHPAIPKQERPPEPPKPEDYKKMSMDYLAAFTLIGAFGGAMVRNKANAPLKAFSATINGWQEGNMQAYKEASAAWEQKNKEVLELNRQRLEEYRMILEDQHLTMDEQMNRLKIASAKWQDRIMWERTSVSDANGAAQAFAMGTKSQEAAQESSQKLTDRRTADDAQASARAEEWGNTLATPQGAKWWNDPNVPAEEKFRTKAYIHTYAPDKYAMLWPDTPKPPVDTTGPGERTGGVPGVEPPPGTPMDTATTAQPQRTPMPPDLRGPVPAGLHPADLAARQFRIESYQAGKGEPSSADWANFYRQQHPGRSAAALALQEFIEDYQGKTGHMPSGEEITRFQTRYNAQTSAGRVIGTRLGNIEVGVQEFSEMMPLASTASKAVPRGKFRKANELRNNLRLQESDPAYQRFVDANESAITAYASTMSRSGANSVHAQQRADHVLSTATSDEAYQAGLQQLQKEIEAVERAPGKALEVIQKLGIGEIGPNRPDRPAPADDGFGQLQVH